MSQHRLQYGAQRATIRRKSATTHGASHTTLCAMREAGSCVAIQILYRDRGATTRWKTQRATRPETRLVYPTTQRCVRSMGSTL